MMFRLLVAVVLNVHAFQGFANSSCESGGFDDFAKPIIPASRAHLPSIDSAVYDGLFGKASDIPPEHRRLIVQMLLRRMEDSKDAIPLIVTNDTFYITSYVPAFASTQEKQNVQLKALYDPSVNRIYFADSSSGQDIIVGFWGFDDRVMMIPKYQFSRSGFDIVQLSLAQSYDRVQSDLKVFLESLETVGINKVGPKRHLIFLEDRHGPKTQVVFRTNYKGSITQLEKISIGGRFSDRFSSFQQRLIDLGYQCEFVEEVFGVARFVNDYEVVLGWVGSY